MDLSGQKLIDRANAYINEKKKGNPTFSIPIEDACDIIIAKSIIKRSQWADLVGNDKRLCIFFRPARKTSNQKFNEEVLEIDCYVPATLDYIAYEVQERVFLLLNEKKVNNRYLYFDGQLGELPTMPGFFCCGSRYVFYRKI